MGTGENICEADVTEVRDDVSAGDSLSIYCWPPAASYKIYVSKRH
jgi:hypothetical protein